MPDPAVEAANRVHEANLGRLIGHDTVVAAAREALASIRALHKPIVKHFHGLLGDRTICEHCHHPTVFGSGLWPCDTARLIYSETELTND